MMRGRIRGTMVGLAGAVVMLVASLVAADVAGAGQTGDPYGPTSTTPPEQYDPTIELSATSGTPGTRITATVSDVPPGSTVRILFDGEEVGRGTAPAAPSAIRGSIGGQGPASVQIDFTVPQVEPGEYVVSAVGPNFTAEFDGFAVLNGEVKVLGSESSGGGGRLAFTGLNVLLLVVLGAALIVGGRHLVKVTRERREARLH